MVVGTTCPSIGGLTWLKGEPLRIPAPGVPLVVEAWATWCGPCIQSIAHLTEVQKRYRDKGLRVVGITSETDVQKLKQFVERKGDGMDYTVAADTGGEMYALMAKAEVRGIPHAFVVDPSGTITYSGHPMDPAFDTAIKAAVDAAKGGAAAAGNGGDAGAERVALPPVTLSLEELMQKSIKELKTILTDRGISTAGCAEKGDLARLIVEQASKVTYYK